jgi:hypothetical protein
MDSLSVVGIVAMTAELGIVFYFKNRLGGQVREFTKAMRKELDPEYPITHNEVLARAQELRTRPYQSLSFSVTTISRTIQLILLRKYNDYPNLQRITKNIRRSVLLYFMSVFGVLFVALALTVWINLRH